jgi:hypothetical protein
VTYFDECKVGDTVLVESEEGRPWRGEITRLDPDATGGPTSIVWVKQGESKSVGVTVDRITLEGEDE